MIRFKFLAAALEQLCSQHQPMLTTLEAVKAKGFVQCGVSQGLPGFSNADDSGNWTGLDVEMCRAVAAAVLGMAVKSSSLLCRQSSVLPH